jgi:alpha-L-fucosidase
MHRVSLFLALLSLTTPLLRAQDGITVEDAAPSAAIVETPAQRDARLAWWRDAKFGLFIHWGIYSVPAGKYGERSTYGEWIFENAKIPVAEYRAFARRFNPVNFDAAAWARVAKQAGMRYVVITAKHHEGFALYPSDVSDWDIAEATPYGKDLLGPLTDAVRAEGLRMGFYYSQAQDWMHPGGAKRGRKDGEGWDEAHKGSFDRYLAEGTIEDLRKEEGGAQGYAKRLRHGEIGKGLNDYDAIFTELKSKGFNGWISIEDGVDGMEQLARSVEFLKKKIAQHWGV